MNKGEIASHASRVGLKAARNDSIDNNFALGEAR